MEEGSDSLHGLTRSLFTYTKYASQPSPQHATPKNNGFGPFMTYWCTRPQTNQCIPVGDLLGWRARELYFTPAFDTYCAVNAPIKCSLCDSLPAWFHVPLCSETSKHRRAHDALKHWVAMLVVPVRIWSTIPWTGLQQAGMVCVGNRLLD